MNNPTTMRLNDEIPSQLVIKILLETNGAKILTSVICA
jgi:hypothetical protein